jgi:hypothetical protein
MTARRQSACLIFPYRQTKGSAAVLKRVTALAESLNARLAVLVPFVRPAAGPACCGVRGRTWEEMVRAVAEEEAEGARRLLAAEPPSRSVTVAEGSSIPEIIASFPTDDGDLLVLPAASERLFSRRDLRQMASRASCTVQRLPR